MPSGGVFASILGSVDPQPDWWTHGHQRCPGFASDHASATALQASPEPFSNTPIQPLPSSFSSFSPSTRLPSSIQAAPAAAPAPVASFQDAAAPAPLTDAFFQASGNSTSSSLAPSRSTTATGFASQDTASLWAKIDKFHGPVEITTEEKSHKAAQAVADADAPKLEGDTVELVEGALRAAAVKASSDCLDYAIALKKFGHNEAIRGDDMNTLAAKAGACLESGSAYIRELAGDGKSFTFNGSLTDSQAEMQQESWDYAKKQCDNVGGHTENSHTLARKDIAPKTLSEVGSCLRAVGKAIHGTVVPKTPDTSEECMPALVALLPPPRSESKSQCPPRRGPLRVTARESCEFLLVSPIC